MYRNVLALVVVGVGFVMVVSAASAQTTNQAPPQYSRDQNTKSLSKYLVSRDITELEWELVQFNLIGKAPIQGKSTT